VRLLGVALPLVLAAVAVAQSTHLEVELLDPQVIQDRFTHLSRKETDRRAILEQLFRDVGCTGDALTTLQVHGSREPDLICTLKGQDPAAGAIVAGGHFDLVPAGMGAIDDWSGAVLLPSLSQSLKNRPRRHDLVFIAFAAEETGLNGSREYVKSLTREQRAAIHGIINLECLGLTAPKVWASRADPHLLDAYVRVARSLQIAADAVNVENIGDDDTHPFRDGKIPTLTMHSVTQQNFEILHTSRDNLKALHPDAYYAAYRLAATLLAYVDAM
jgi:hypothetical protein